MSDRADRLGCFIKPLKFFVTLNLIQSLSLSRFRIKPAYRLASLRSGQTGPE